MKLTAQDVYKALLAELKGPHGYISPDPLSLSSVTVDGVIGCDSIAEYLNNILEAKGKIQ